MLYFVSCCFSILGELYILATSRPSTTSRKGVIYQIIEPERFDSDNIYLDILVLLIVYFLYTGEILQNMGVGTGTGTGAGKALAGPIFQ